MGDLDGKVALITGATQAVGESIARRLAAAAIPGVGRSETRGRYSSPHGEQSWSGYMTGTTLNVDGRLPAKALVAGVAQQSTENLAAGRKEH